MKGTNDHRTLYNSCRLRFFPQFAVGVTRLNNNSPDAAQFLQYPDKIAAFFFTSLLKPSAKAQQNIHVQSTESSQPRHNRRYIFKAKRAVSQGNTTEHTYSEHREQPAKATQKNAHIQSTESSQPRQHNRTHIFGL